ncbi:MAG: hypothetical protein Q4E73_00405 [Lachnospiraceae bacterium]|nr:hypothetical protein [Lachnospiraceae bacterium]
MSDYFKFCPKCGRVLDRDWCPHCEPEKEKKFRKDQLKLDRDMFENYSKDAPATHLFSGKPKKVKFPGKETTSAQVYESKKEVKKEQTKFSWSKVLAVVVVIVPIMIDFLDINPFHILGYIPLPSPIKSVISSFESTSVMEDGYENLSDDDSMEDFEYAIRMEQLPEEDGGEICYTIGDTEYSYSISRPVIYDWDENEVGGDVQDEIDKVCQQWYQEGLEAKRNHLPVNGYLVAFTTYLDDSMACIVLEGSKYYDDDKEDEALLYSFIIDLENMLIYDPLEGEELAPDLYDTITNQIDTNEFTPSDFSAMLKAGKYCTIADSKGDLWIGLVIDDGYERIINLKLEDMNLYD